VTENFLFLDFGIRAGAMTAMFLVALIVLFSRAKLAFKVAISLMMLGGIGHLIGGIALYFPHCRPFAACSEILVANSGALVLVLRLDLVRRDNPQTAADGIVRYFRSHVVYHLDVTRMAECGHCSTSFAFDYIDCSHNLARHIWAKR